MTEMRIIENKDDNVFDLAARREQPKLKVDWRGPDDKDWLSTLSSGTEFWCKDRTGRTPKWSVQDFTHCGKLKGYVLLAPTVTLQDPRTWFWVEPVSFCKDWDFLGIIEETEIPHGPGEDSHE